MQDNRFSEFDSQIRMMMEDASEAAPVRAWSAIDKKLKHKRAVILWRRIGVGVALAALGFAVVLPESLKNGGAKPSVAPAVELVAENSPADQENTVTAEEQNQATTVTPSTLKTVSQFIAQVSVPEQMKENVIPAEEEQMTPAPEEIYEIDVPVEERISEGQRTEATSTPEPVKEDPFLQMEREDALARMHKSGSRTSLDLKGTLSSNDNIKKPVFLGKYGSPASFKTATGDARVYENSEVSYDIPVSFGLGARFSLSEKLAIGTGVSYSRLGSSFRGFFDSVPADKIVHTVQYVGIPVNLYYNVIKFDALDIYCFVGGEVEKNILNRYKVGSGKDSQIYDDKTKGLQWSVAGGLGLEYHIADKFGIYFDPSARYFFDCDQPTSIRTKKPFQFSFEAGFRFDL